MRCCLSVFGAWDGWGPEELDRRWVAGAPGAAAERDQRRCMILDAGRSRSCLGRTWSYWRCRVIAQSFKKYKNDL